MCIDFCVNLSFYFSRINVQESYDPEIAGSYGSFMFTLIRNCQMVSQSGCNNFTPTSSFDAATIFFFLILTVLKNVFQPRDVGWGGEWEGGSRGSGHMYTYGWFTFSYDRNQTIKQLSFNEKQMFFKFCCDILWFCSLLWCWTSFHVLICHLYLLLGKTSAHFFCEFYNCSF